MSRVHVFRYEDGDPATSFAEVAVRAAHAAEAVELLLRHGMHPAQLWDRGRTCCTADGRPPAGPDDGAVVVRRHLQDGSVTPWEPPRAGLDRRRQSRSRAATSAAQ